MMSINVFFTFLFVVTSHIRGCSYCVITDMFFASKQQLLPTFLANCLDNRFREEQTDIKNVEEGMPLMSLSSPRSRSVSCEDVEVVKGLGDKENIEINVERKEQTNSEEGVPLMQLILNP